MVIFPGPIRCVRWPLETLFVDAIMHSNEGVLRFAYARSGGQAHPSRLYGFEIVRLVSLLAWRGFCTNLSVAMAMPIADRDHAVLGKEISGMPECNFRSCGKTLES